MAIAMVGAGVALGIVAWFRTRAPWLRWAFLLGGALLVINGVMRGLAG